MRCDSPKAGVSSASEGALSWPHEHQRPGRARGQHAAPISREAAIAGSAPPAAVDGLLRPARAPCSAHVPSLWDQPRCVLPLAATVRSPTPGKPGGRSADPPAPSGAATPDPTSRGRADPDAARGVPALGQSQTRGAAPARRDRAVRLERRSGAAAPEDARGASGAPPCAPVAAVAAPAACAAAAARVPGAAAGDLVQVDTLDTEVLP